MGEVAELGLKRSIYFDLTLIEKVIRLIVGSLVVHPRVVMRIRDFPTLDLPITGHGCHPAGVRSTRTLYDEEARVRRCVNAEA